MDTSFGICPRLLLNCREVGLLGERELHMQECRQWRYPAQGKGLGAAAMPLKPACGGAAYTAASTSRQHLQQQALIWQVERVWEKMQMWEKGLLGVQCPCHADFMVAVSSCRAAAATSGWWGWVSR